MANASGTEEWKAEGSIFGAQIQSAVKAELEMILTAPAFAQSNRCKKFLSYVVLQTLAGHASQLKERTIGISVFDRAYDYDTGGDSIVRVTSNEVRKRIAQFYRESRAAHPVQIELARGTYVPEFIIRAARRDNGAAEIAASDHSGRDPVAAQASSTAEAPSVSPFRIDRTAGVQAQIARTNASERKRSFKLLIFMALPIFLLVSGATTVVVSRDRAKNRIPQIWDAFQHSNVPVLICLGTHNLSDLSPEPSPDRETFTDLVLHKEMIPVDDVTAITRMASLLGHKGIPFRVVGAGLTSLTDLRRQPVILIGAVDNKWTLRLTQDLRYRIEFVRPAPNQEPIASITDAEQPGSTPWTIDFSVPMLAWKYDYAIVARVDDPTTGVPVLIDAGLGNDGSLAASELIASDALTKALAGEPHCREKSNFEAVVGTDIIDAKSGPPHILRLDCW